MGRVETRSNKGKSASAANARGGAARSRSNGSRSRRRVEAPAGSLARSIALDLALIALLGFGAFIACAVYYAPFSEPTGPRIQSWLHTMVGSGMYFVPLVLLLLPGILFPNSMRIGFLRAWGGSAALVLLSSLYGGLFTGSGWGGILGDSCAAFATDKLGGFYIVVLILLSAVALMRLAGQAFLIPAGRAIGAGALAAGRGISAASATLTPVLASAGAGVRNAIVTDIERRRAAILQAELDAADSPEGDSPLLREYAEAAFEDDGGEEPEEAAPRSRRGKAKDKEIIVDIGARRNLPPVSLSIADPPVPDDAFAEAVAAAGSVLGNRLVEPDAEPSAAATPPSELEDVEAQEAPEAPPRELPHSASVPQLTAQYPHVLKSEAELAEGQLPLFGSTLAGYELPPMSLLRDAPQRSGEEEHLERRAGIIERTLKSFNVDATCVNAVIGPRVTRYELKIGPGINVSKIHNLADNLALELAVKAVRIEAPIPGLSAVGIEVPNAVPDLVTLKSILESPLNQRSNHPLTVGLGRDIAGQPIVANLAKMPHVLVAGSTGSGKSVCLNALIVSLLMRNAPDTLRLILIDPKRVEMTGYSEIPHLACPVVHDVQQALSALKWTVAEMERRYRLLEARRARNIAAYNAAAAPGEGLPFIVVVVDELADLMMLAGQAFEKLICRIAQLSRAVGIHLVIATQRPDVKVITGTIKANIPSRVAFAVVSQIDSRTILDSGGAEKLLGSGDMLFSPIGENGALRVQGCFLSDDEIEGVVEHCRKQARVRYDEMVLSFAAEDAGSGAAPVDGNWVDASLAGGGQAARRARDEHDEYFEEALEIVRDSNRASTSYLQRRLKIGYNRAARVMEELEAAGYVSAPDSRGDRKVL